MSEFLGAVLPYTVLAAALLCAVLFFEKKERIRVEVSMGALNLPVKIFFRRLGLYLGLLILCFLVVFRVLPYLPVLGVVAAARVPVRTENFEGDRLYAPSDLSLLLRIHRKRKAH